MKLFSSIFRRKSVVAAPGVGKTFFDLSAREQKKIIGTAARQANDDQRKLVAGYKKQYCRSQAS